MRSTATSLEGSASFGELIIVVIGALVITTEFGTRMLGTSLAAMPRRGVLYAAKAIAVTCVTLVVALVTSFASFFAGQAVLASTHAGASITSPGAPRAVLLTALFVACCALLAFGLGAVIRHTAGAITGLFGLVFVIPVVATALPDSVRNDVVRWLPGNSALYPIMEQVSLSTDLRVSEGGCALPAVMVLLHSLAAYRPRRVSLCGLFMCEAVVVIGLTSSQQAVVSTKTAWVALELTVPIACSWIFGDSVAYRRAHNAWLEERARRAEAERDTKAQLAAAAERSRIAREMHDIIAHNLSVIVGLADGGRYAAARSPERSSQALGAIASTGREALSESRWLLGVLTGDDGRAADLAPHRRDAGGPGRAVGGAAAHGLPDRAGSADQHPQARRAGGNCQGHPRLRRRCGGRAGHRYRARRGSRLF